jgi:hypothetical protein
MGSCLDDTQGPCLTSVSIFDGFLQVEFDCRDTFDLPYLFLKDSCPSSFDARSGQRSFTAANLLEAPVAEDAGIARKLHYNGLVVVWKDGSESNFDSKWLHERCTAPAHAMGSGIPHQLWDRNKMAGKVPTFNFREIAVDDRTQLHLLESLLESGLALVRETPCRQSALQRDIVQRIFGSFGMTKPFTFKIDSHSKSEGLGARAIHSELSYCEDLPGIMAILCVKMRPSSHNEDSPEQHEPAPGGEFLVVDGLTLAEVMRTGHAAEYGA